MTTERWRYCCPECGTHTLHPRASGGYRCDVCNAVVEHKYDKKREKLTS